MFMVCEAVAAQKTDVIFLEADGAPSAIELICPSAPSGNESLQRFLAKKGAGLHHICYAVADIHASLAALKQAGIALIDETPRLGARGHLVAFLHPKATGGVLFELCQAGEHAATDDR
jgi:methylmalonyl-CoA/ethylmalonyl-CoA epimerase